MRLSVLAVLAGMTVTALILASPYLTFGVQSPSAHLLLNALDAFVALLVAYLVHGRFLRKRRLQDLLLSQALAALVVAGLGLTYLARALPDTPPGTLDVWLPLSVRVLGAVLIAASALAHDRTVAPTRWHRWPVLPLTVAVGTAWGLLWAVRSQLPVALDLTNIPRTAQHPILTGHPMLLIAQGFAALCFALAAAVFTRQAARSHDTLLRWVGPACVLAAFARLHYLLFPSVYTDWLYTGDLLRTGCYVLLLVGATREIQQFWSAQADVAVLEDRRRLARELHDGVIQELSYIKVKSFALPDGAGTDEILSACDRALDEARSAVHALGSPDDEPLSATLERAVRQLAERYAVEVRFVLDDTVTAEPDQRHALVRIAREAISNAVRHGNAPKVEVVLDQPGLRRRLVVRDEGSGFNPPEAGSRAGPTGYGLTSMRDRAGGLPGHFHIESAPGAGSVVTVTW